MSTSITQYFGGKGHLHPFIIPIINSVPHRTYCIPYGGMASTLVNKKPSFVEYYNDMDGRVVNFMRVVRDNPNELVRLLRLTPYARSEFNDCKGASSDPLEDARRVFVLLTQGGNGNLSDPTWLRRSGKGLNGGRRPKYFQSKAENLLNFVTKRLTSVYIEQCPAIDLMRYLDNHDVLFYVDPPYLPEKRSSAKYSNDMTYDDHVELIDLLPTLKAKIIISGYDNDLYNNGLVGWNTEEKEVATRGHTENGSTMKVEKVWYNFDRETQGRFLI